MAYIESCSDAGIGMEQFYQLVERLCAKHEITLPRLMRAIDLLRDLNKDFPICTMPQLRSIPQFRLCIRSCLKLHHARMGFDGRCL